MNDNEIMDLNTIYNIFTFDVKGVHEKESCFHSASLGKYTVGEYSIYSDKDEFEYSLIKQSLIEELLEKIKNENS